MEEFDLEYQYQLFLKNSDVLEANLPAEQIDILKTTFYAGAIQILFLLKRMRGLGIDQEQGVALMKKLEAQGLEYVVVKTVEYKNSNESIN